MSCGEIDLERSNSTPLKASASVLSRASIVIVIFLGQIIEYFSGTAPVHEGSYSPLFESATSLLLSDFMPRDLERKRNAE